MYSEVSESTVKQDIEKILEASGSLGESSDKDRAARQLLQHTEILRKRLESPSVLEAVYFGYSNISHVLPVGAFLGIQNLVIYFVTLTE